MTKRVITGLNKLYYAIMTDEELETYSAVKYFPGLREIGVSPKEEMASTYAENLEWEVDSALGEIEVTIDITDVPHDIVNDILGKTKASVGGYIDNANDVKPYIALMFDKTLSGGITEYVHLYKGKFNLPEDKAKTKEGKPEFQTKALTGRFLPLKNGDWKHAVRSDDADFVAETWAAKWGKEVIMAAPKPVSLVELALSSSVPADEATGVAINSSPTLTFNNKILNCAVSLIDTVTLANVPSTLSFDATGKILTINPASDLTAATKYAIVVSKVTDIYGQVLENTIVDFTTA